MTKSAARRRPRCQEGKPAKNIVVDMKVDQKMGSWPRWRRSLLVGSVAGLLLAAAWMGWMAFVSTLPAPTPGSLPITVSPWWKASNWVSASVVFIVSGAMMAVLTALRPVNTDKKDPNQTTYMDGSSAARHSRQ